MPENPNPTGPADETPKDGDPADESGTASAQGSDNEDQGDGEPDLGEAGKKALRAEREARKTAEKKATELESENARLRRSNAANKGTDLDAIKAEIRAEFAVQLAETAIKAEAKGRLQDPADALLFIKAADVAEGDDAIEKAIDQLLKDRPYLASTTGPKPWGDVGGGKRDTSKPEPTSALERMARAYGSN